MNCIEKPCELFNRDRKDRIVLERLLKTRFGNSRFGNPCSLLSSKLFKMGVMPIQINGIQLMKENTHIYSVLGMGEYGTVLGVCCIDLETKREQRFAIKIVPEKYGNDKVEMEIEMHKIFVDLSLAPDIYHTASAGGNTFISMEQIDITLFDFLVKNKSSIGSSIPRIFEDFENAIRLMFTMRVYHGDMHLDNIFVRTNSSGQYEGLGLIDFGFSGAWDESNEQVMLLELQMFMEYIQVLRTVDENLGRLGPIIKKRVMSTLNLPKFEEIRRVFQVGDDLENNEKTQDESLCLVHEFWRKEGNI